MSKWHGHHRLVLGTQLSTSVSGNITALRYFKAAEEEFPAHTGRVYDASNGELLASVTFVDASCQGAGWVSVALPSPVVTVAHAEYVVAIDNVLHYPEDAGYWATAQTRGKLRFSGGKYGVTSGVMPAEATSSNYWIDGKHQ